MAHAVVAQQLLKWLVGTDLPPSQRPTASFTHSYRLEHLFVLQAAANAVAAREVQPQQANPILLDVLRRACPSTAHNFGCRSTAADAAQQKAEQDRLLQLVQQLPSSGGSLDRHIQAVLQRHGIAHVALPVVQQCLVCSSKAALQVEVVSSSGATTFYPSCTSAGVVGKLYTKRCTG